MYQLSLIQGYSEIIHTYLGKKKKKKKKKKQTPILLMINSHSKDYITIIVKQSDKNKQSCLLQYCYQEVASVQYNICTHRIGSLVQYHT